MSKLEQLDPAQMTVDQKIKMQEVITFMGLVKAIERLALATENNNTAGYFKQLVDTVSKEWRIQNTIIEKVEV